MKIKHGVDPADVRGEILLAIMVADGVWRDLGQELVITSLVEGEHRPDSLHYSNLAVDLRTHYFTDAEKELACRILRSKLGTHYQTIKEATHIHVEFDQV